MIVKDREYLYKIAPKNHAVLAEIYEVRTVGDTQHNIFLISKTFKNWFGPIKDKDYKDAKEWALNHLQNIYHSNK